LSADGQRWVHCRARFFLSVRVLSRLFHRLFMERLETAFNSAKLQFFGSLESLRNPVTFAERIARAKESDWVVYAKRPFAGPQQVLDYVGRYTHRVAISNNVCVRGNPWLTGLGSLVSLLCQACGVGWRGEAGQRLDGAIGQTG